ncbi:MAG: hypothetical protein CM15mV50_790 [uncultured marine virus]|nr:MAG: hypothetical protein CM15mV50_790 [uncultured marine virus]
MNNNPFDTFEIEHLSNSSISLFISNTLSGFSTTCIRSKVRPMQLCLEAR